MKLYYIIDGAPSIAVRMLLKQLGLKYEHQVMDFGAGDHLTEAYVKMNPQKAIPVLDDDGFYLSESNAIMQYLMDKYASDSDLYPKDAKTRALINHRLCFNLGSFYPPILEYALMPIFFDIERTPEKLKRIESALTALEEYMKRAGGKYIVGNNLTIADFPLIISMMCLEVINFDFTPYPLLNRWYEDFKQQHGDLWELADVCFKEYRKCIENPPDFSHLYPNEKLIKN